MINLKLFLETEPENATVLTAVNFIVRAALFHKYCVAICLVCCYFSFEASVCKETNDWEHPYIMVYCNGIHKLRWQNSWWQCAMGEILSVFCELLTFTVYSKKYAHGFVVLCFVVVMQSFIMNSYEVFIHIHQGCFACTGAIVRLPQCQWSKPDGYGEISQCITTTNHISWDILYVMTKFNLYKYWMCIPNRSFHI